MLPRLNFRFVNFGGPHRSPPLRWQLSLFFASSTLAAEDWPRWRGRDGNGHVPAGVVVPTALPAEARYVWRKKIGFGVGSPVVSRGVTYYLDNQENRETLHAVDAGTGEGRWHVAIDETFKDNQSAVGPRSTPVVDGDRIYLQSGRGEFQCLDTATGHVQWRTNFVTDFGAVFTGEKGTTPGAGRHGYTGSALVDGDHLLVGVGGVEGASVVCFNKRDGRVIWKSQNDMPGNGGPIVATLAGIKQVVSFTAEAAMGLRFDTGELLWRLPIKTSYGRHVASPIVIDDLVLVGSHQAGLIAIKISPDKTGCRAETSYIEKRLAPNFSSPVLGAGLLYGLGPAGVLFCADARTGIQKWSHDSPAIGSKAHAAFLVMHENILVLADTGELLLIAADPMEYRLISRLKICGATWCNPAYAGGRLFVRDAEELLCVALLP
ncbi:MAG: hypothetical protein RL077_4652 [Verrucomicrobiota bacterium]